MKPFPPIDPPAPVADIGNWCPTEMNPCRTGPLTDQAARGRDYADMLGSVADAPWLIGWHWCALAENQARGWGLKDPWDNPYKPLVDQVQACNRQVLADHQKGWS